MARKTSGVQQVVTIAVISALDNATLVKWRRRLNHPQAMERGGKGEDLRCSLTSTGRSGGLRKPKRWCRCRRSRPRPPCRRQAVTPGETMTLIDEIAARTLPGGIGLAWTAMSYQERLVGHQTYVVFAQALVLAGQYASW
jgi:hypothetical protein